MQFLALVRTCYEDLDSQKFCNAFTKVTFPPPTTKIRGIISKIFLVDAITMAMRGSASARIQHCGNLI